MSLKTARLACTALGKRIMLGYPAANGRHFKGDPVDVTSDCLKAVIEHVEPGYEITVTVDGKPKYTIGVKEIAAIQQTKDTK